MQDFATGKAAARGGAMPKLNCSGLLLKNYRHAVRIMKITAFILLAFCLHVAAKTKAQGNITLKEKGASIIKVMTEVQRQTGYDFLVTSETINRAKPVDIEVKDAPLSQVLEIVFKNQPLTYTIKDKLITIRLKADNKLSSSQQISPTGDPVTVSGKVTDENGQPLAGANVKVKGSNTGVTTDNQGRFTLNNVDPNATLEISFVGHETQLLSVKGKTVFTVALGQKVGTLDETVVIAYGTTTKRLNTGNVSSVKASEIERQPVNNPLLALQGRVPGMEIIQSTGLPGSGVTVKIRGQNSIDQGNEPLYIIDGVPYPSQNIANLGSIWGNASGGQYGSALSYINPADIESIDVLKDADATAIYGSRGANGVVLITTKKGKVGQAKLNFNVQSGWGKITRSLDLLGTRQYLDMRYEAFRNDGATPQSWDYDMTHWDTTRYTDWQKELIGGTSKYNNVQGSVSGGNNNIQFFIGSGYSKETTVFPGDMDDEKASIHFNINSYSDNKKFKLMVSGNYLVDNNQLMSQDLTSLATSLAPTAPAIYNNDGSLNWEPDASGIGTWNNPLAYQLLKFNSGTNNVVGNAVLSYELFDGLSLKSSFGYNYTQTDQITVQPLAYNDPFYWQIYGNQQRISRFANNKFQSWIIEPQIDYNIRIGQATLALLMGTTIQQNSSNRQGLYASGFNSDLAMENIAFATNVIGSTAVTEYKYNALFGRLNYNWMDKYLLNFTARRDGTSRFGPERQFQNFGAAGFGWIFSKEKLIQKKLPFLSFGKLRGSYGTAGNDQVGDYTFLDLYRSISVGVPYQASNGLQPTQLFTPDLGWEETRKLEAGIELGFLMDKVFFTTSYYKNRSSNQLVQYTLPYVTGFSSVKKNLDALVQNSGWELYLRTVNLNSKNFRWTTSFNLTLNRNKLVSVAKGMSAFYERMKGLPLSSQFVYRFMGVDESSGVYQFDDGYGKPTTQPDTSYLLSQYPINTFAKYYGGIQNSIFFKGFQLDFLFQFVKQIGPGLSLGNYPGSYSGGGLNQPVSVLSRWRKPGDKTDIQRYNQDYSIYQSYSNAQLSDRFYSDASFIRLKNVSISWELPKKLEKAIHLKGGRFYLQAQNLLTITNYTGLDPESLSVTSLPPLRVITLGAQVTL